MIHGRQDAHKDIGKLKSRHVRKECVVRIHPGMCRYRWVLSLAFLLHSGSPPGMSGKVRGTGFFEMLTRDHQGRATDALGPFQDQVGMRSIATAFGIPETPLHGV